METVIYIPRNAEPPLVFTDGASRAELPEMPADGLPLRVALGGQLLGRGDFTVTDKIITIDGDWTNTAFSVDYYLSSVIDITAGNPNTQYPNNPRPDLPALDLYTVIPTIQTDGEYRRDEGVIDLLIAMVDHSEYDLLYNGTDLSLDPSLKSAITLSVYSDALVDGERGWWGDTYHSDYPIASSKLWTLMGSDTTQNNLLKAEQYLRDATRWLIDDGHFSAIDIHTEHQAQALDWLAYSLTCKRDGEPDHTFRSTMR